MAQPPDFGGREIEEGLEEDLGVPAAEFRHHSPHPGRADLESNEARAVGQMCALCGAQITAGQDVRRRQDGRWMHEVCPG